MGAFAHLSVPPLSVLARTTISFNSGPIPSLSKNRIPSSTA